MCSCARGYTFKDKNRCSAENASSLTLYFAHEKAIFSVNATGSNPKVVVNTTGASGLDFLYGRNTLYWSDVKTKRVNIGFFLIETFNRFTLIFREDYRFFFKNISLKVLFIATTPKIPNNFKRFKTIV